MRIALVLLLCLGLCGCAMNSGIVPMGKDTFMISRQAAAGSSSSSKLKVKALQEANRFCVNRGKHLQVIRITEARPPYVFDNSPKVEVYFMALDADDPEFKRPKIGPNTYFK